MREKMSGQEYRTDKRGDPLLKRYQQLVEAAGDVIFSTDERGYFTYINAPVERVLGHKAEDVVDKHYTTFIHPECLEPVTQFYLRQLNERIPETRLEYRAITVSGNPLWVEQIVTLVQEGDHVVGFNGFMRDISRRKIAEEALAAKENRIRLFEKIVEAIPDHIYVKDRQGRCIYVNAATWKNDGFTSAEDMLGKDDRELFGTDGEATYADEQVLMQTGEPIINHEFRSPLQHAGREWVLISKVPLLDDQGNISGLIGVNRDITELKRTEEALRQSQWLIERINNTVPDEIFIFDLQKRVTVYTNRERRMWLGYSAAQVEAMGSSMMETVMHPDDLLKFEERARRFETLPDGFVLETTYRLRHAAGHWMYMYVQSTIFTRDEAGKPTQLLGIARDITEQVKADAALKASEERTRIHLQYLKALNEINLELSSLNSFDDLCRRAIGLGRSRLSFDRLGLFILDETQQRVMGTYGTDIQGNLRDERYLATSIDSTAFEWVSAALKEKQRFKCREDAPLYDNYEIVGHGWNAMALLWSGEKIIGWLTADNLLNQQPLQDYQLELLSLYATALEHFIVRIRSEHALHDSNYRYNELVANVPGMVYRIHDDGNSQPVFDYVSPRCIELNDLEPEAVMANPALLSDHILPEYRPEHDRIVREAFSHLHPFYWEGQVMVRGEKRWRRRESRPKRLEDGTIVWDGIEMDITAQKRAEAALRQSEERYRAVVEDQTEFICRYRPDTRLTFVNDAMCRYFKRTREEMIGQSFLNDIPESYRAFVLNQIETAGTSKTTVIYEHPTILQNGDVRWHEWKDRPIFDDNGRLIEYQAIGRDVTERRETESERDDYIKRLEIIQRVDVELTQNLNFDYVLKIALDAAVRISNADAGAIHLLEGNDLRVAQVIGNFPATMIGAVVPMTHGIVGRVARQGVPELITDVTRDPDYIKNILETRVQMTLPLISQGQDRLIGVLNVQSREAGRFTAPMFEFLKVLAVRIATALDNARLHHTTEQQLAQLTALYQQVSELEQLKTQMIRIAAHDLRNPLGVITGFVQVLADELTPHLSNKNYEQIGIIKDSINRIDKITRDILTLERISAGRELVADVIDLREMVATAFADCRAQAVQKNQTITLELPKKPVLTHGDRFMLPETFVNLITNAIKYTPDEGKIVVSLKVVDKKAVFKVVDNGYGIPAEQQAGLFQAFYRVKLKETRSIKGTGLGLHLVKNIVERHKGVMHFASEHGKGSSFGFELPIIHQSAAPRKRRKTASTGDGS